MIRRDRLQNTLRVTEKLDMAKNFNPRFQKSRAYPMQVNERLFRLPELDLEKKACSFV